MGQTRHFEYSKLSVSSFGRNTPLPVFLPFVGPKIARLAFEDFPIPKKTPKMELE